MKETFIRHFLICLLVIFLMNASGVFGASFLFDASKRETAGDADWVVDTDMPDRPERYPSPPGCLATPCTHEEFWTGALSAWGVALAGAGHRVETLPLGCSITYGDSTNPQDLGFYDVFVVCEPQIKFTAGQVQAALEFLQNGGSLFMISNHAGSDRNNNGADSVVVWNEFGAEQHFGFRFMGEEESNNDVTNEECDNFSDDPDHPILHGLWGDVESVGIFNGTTLTINKSMNSSVSAFMWMNGKPQGDSCVAAAVSEYGAGRVAAFIDSSPCSDGTGNPSDSLRSTWANTRNTNDIFFMNVSEWLAETAGARPTVTPRGGCSPTPTCPPQFSPTPTPVYRQSVLIYSNKYVYRAGDDFELLIRLENPLSPLYLNLYIVLDAYGEYFFYPSWGKMLDCERRWLCGGFEETETILEFVWPEGAGCGEVGFYAGLARPVSYCFVSLDTYSFSFQ